MSNPSGFGTKKKPDPVAEDLLKKSRQGISLAKTTLQVAKDLQGKNPQAAFSRMIVGGMKLAEVGGSIFYSPGASPLQLVEGLKKIGLNTLAWEPETLMAELDRRYRGWTPERVVSALERFQRTEKLDTEVPPLVRDKIHAIRMVATTDSPHTEWNVFEKVGGAFNDRIPQFGLVEPLSAAECARTVMYIEGIRPDSYSDEVKIYIAGCCHTDGLYTVEPIKPLTMAESFLKKMISDENGEGQDLALKSKIIAKFRDLETSSSKLLSVDEGDVVTVQALRLLATQHHSTEGL